jgi:hypothetical protein
MAVDPLLGGRHQLGGDARRRQPRASAPSVVGRRDDVTPARAKLDRYRRQSVNAVYVPGQVAADVDFIPADDPDYEFPTWWFFVIPSQYYLEWMFGGCLWGIVFPHTVSVVFGTADKALVLGAIGTMGTVISFAGPIVGSISDRLPERFPSFCRRFGRRRPFIALGQGLNVLCLYFCKRGCEEKNVIMLILSLQISNLTNQLANPPFAAIVPETVPESQRGLCMAIQGWLCQVFVLAANGMGLLVGEGHLPDAFIWDAYLFTTAVSIPLACWACSGTACGPLPWQWTPERLPTALQLREKRAAQEQQRRARAAAAAASSARTARLGCCGAAWEELREFTAAMRHPPYFWMWVQGFVGSVGGIIQGCFQFFWFQARLAIRIPRHCSWGPRNIYRSESLWVIFLWPR